MPNGSLIRQLISPFHLSRLLNVRALLDFTEPFGEKYWKVNQIISPKLFQSPILTNLAQQIVLIRLYIIYITRTSSIALLIFTVCHRWNFNWTINADWKFANLLVGVRYFGFLPCAQFYLQIVYIYIYACTSCLYRQSINECFERDQLAHAFAYLSR